MTHRTLKYWLASLWLGYYGWIHGLWPVCCWKRRLCLLDVFETGMCLPPDTTFSLLFVGCTVLCLYHRIFLLGISLQHAPLHNNRKYCRLSSNTVLYSTVHGLLFILAPTEERSDTGQRRQNAACKTNSISLFVIKLLFFEPSI